MIVYTTASSQSDLEGILELQKANLPPVLSLEERTSQGFVTISHSYGQLASLNDIEKHVVAKDGDSVVGYLLSMTPSSHSIVPALQPMFEHFDRMRFGEKVVADCDYIVVGQACIDRRYRGTGVLDNCYALFREVHQHKYAFAITEIDAANTRSLAAHRRIGFREAGSYAVPEGVRWTIVLWDWQAPV